MSTRDKYGNCLCKDCVEFRKLSDKERRTSGKRREWEKQNRDKLNKSQNKWNKKNPERVKIIQKKYRDTNKEKIKIYNRTYKLTSSAIYSQLGKGRKKRRPITISKEDFIEWYNRQEKKCFYCDIPIEKIDKFPLFFNGTVNRRLSIDRLDNLKNYEKGNLVLSCRRCNSIKSDFFSAEEMKKVAQNYIKPKWNKL